LNSWLSKVGSLALCLRIGVGAKPPVPQFGRTIE
jgi:hypothetical protein